MMMIVQFSYRETKLAVTRTLNITALPLEFASSANPASTAARLAAILGQSSPMERARQSVLSSSRNRDLSAGINLSG